MKRFALFAALAALVIGSISCGKKSDDDPKNNPYKQVDLTTKSAEFVRQGNAFAFRFIDRVNNETPGDFIISPLSMQFLLGMILNGANGNTADEICKVLGYGAGETETVNAYCLSMLQQLPGLDKKTTLSIANAIVMNQNYLLLDSYQSTVSQYYVAEVANMDFTDNAGTTQKINKWCSDHTGGMIPEILKAVEPDILAYLMNAMYFKSEWTEKFSKGNTAKEAFTKEDGQKTKVPMMKTEHNFSYEANNIFRAVRLPYGNGAYVMTVLLPSEGKTLVDVIHQLDGQSWQAFDENLISCEVDLWLPKFETRFHIKLNDILSGMGMPSSFDDRADFSAMSDDAAYLSFVQQDAVIKVDEEGSEAAAVSSAGVYTESISANMPVAFHADHPFLYLITETSTGAILFAGKYSGE